jgi:hypothetical protein
MIWFFFQILKTVLIVAAVLAYAEVGPGGDILWNLIQSTKELVLSVDYGQWWSKITAGIQDFASTVLNDQGDDHE